MDDSRRIPHRDQAERIRVHQTYVASIAVRRILAVKRRNSQPWRRGDRHSSAGETQSSAEEGLAEEVGGPVTRLPTREVGGLEVWSTTAKTTDSELTQAMLRNEGKLYKLMAIKNGAEPNTEAINAFMESVQLAKSPRTAAEGTNGTSPSSQEGGIDLHNLSKRTGRVAFLAIIALLIYRATKKPPTIDGNESYIEVYSTCSIGRHTPDSLSPLSGIGLPSASRSPALLDSKDPELVYT